MDSILNSVKQILGMDDTYTAFDLDVITHTNSALAVLNQLGVGPADPVVIVDASNTWDELALPPNQLSMVKTYLYLKVKMIFDPPGTSFGIDALKETIQEHEYRIKEMREELLPVPDDSTTEETWPVWG